MLLGFLVVVCLAGAAGAGSTAVAAPSDLVAAYGFGGSGTTVRDDSGNANTGTISGAAWSTAGKNGQALSFDGVNDWVTVADSAALDLTSGMTLEAWVRPTALGSSWRTALIKEQPGNLAYALYAHNGASGPSGHVFVGGDRFGVAPTALPTKTWTHLATTYDGATIRVYANGAQVARRAQTGAIATSNSPLRLGGNTVWPEWFKGSLDDVRVYNRALSAAEIMTDMATPVAAGSPAPRRHSGAHRAVEPSHHQHDAELALRRLERLHRQRRRQRLQPLPQQHADLRRERHERHLHRPCLRDELHARSRCL